MVQPNDAAKPWHRRIRRTSAGLFLRVSIIRQMACASVIIGVQAGIFDRKDFGSAVFPVQSGFVRVSLKHDGAWLRVHLEPTSGN